MPAFVRKPVNMDVCISRSLSFPDSYGSIALALKKSSPEKRMNQICPFHPGFVRLFFFFIRIQSVL
jgi:hypothetical protein